MKRKKDGGSAFPVPMVASKGDCVDINQQGMTLRDWFAGQALAGLLSYNGSHDTPLKIENVADSAYDYAEAMIRMRPYYNDFE